MIIFQTAGSGNQVGAGLRLGAHLLGDLSAQATTYQDNSYVHRLNRTLQAEIRAVSAYRSLGAKRTGRLDESLAGHQAAGRELQRLIVANRGIPEDRPAVSLGLSKTVVRIFARVPTRFGERVTHRTLLRLETQLTARYRALLKLAPSRDFQALTEILKRTERNVADLK